MKIFALCVVKNNGQYRIREEHLPDHLDSLPHALVKRLMHGLRIWP